MHPKVVTVLPQDDILESFGIFEMAKGLKYMSFGRSNFILISIAKVNPKAMCFTIGDTYQCATVL